MYRDKRLRRAMLLIPGDSLKRIAEGATLNADSVVLDLEDSVALNRKETARETVRQALQSDKTDFSASERLVRVNRLEEKSQIEDIALTIHGHPDGYVLPKVEAAREIQQVSHILLEHELLLGYETGSIKLLAVIESARGVVNMRDIAQADQRLVALVLESEGLAGDIGAVRSKRGGEMAYARGALVMHASAYGLQAIDTPYTYINDIEGLCREAEEARRMGYTGKMAVQPSQVEPLLSVFSPDDDEVHEAQRLVSAYHRRHESVFVHEGRLVDMTTIRAAERLLERAKALSQGPGVVKTS